MNGLQIGLIKTISLDNDYKIIAEIIINKGVTIPKDTEFKIVNEDILGTKAIELTPGKSTEIIKNRDTVYGINETELSVESLTIRIMELIEKIKGTERTDSLITEIKRLNDNLERLKMK